MSDTEKNFPGIEKKDTGRKKDGKKDKKEKGYVMIAGDGSDDDLVSQEDLKSPTKMKKGKAFRFGPKKDIFPKVKDDKKEKDGKKEEKEKRKEEKEGKKHKLKVKKKSKHHEIQKTAVPAVIEKPVFGVPLATALERNRSHDGIQLPALFRECIDYIEEHGLHCEGIYRISGVKSKVQHLKDSYNRGEPVYLEEHEPNIVAGVLKQFLRELPEPVLTNALIPKFEEASTIRNERKRIEAFLKLIRELPEGNRLLLSWMIVHMTHVIERQKENKMTLQNVSIVLSPTMQISHRVLNVLFSHTKQLFKDTIIKRYVPPLKPATSRWSLELPDNPQALQEELGKQESLLDQLHEELAAGEGDPEKEEQIWEVQRVCTQLKRKIKLAQKNQDTLEKRRKERDEQSKRNTVVEEGEEDLRLELQEAPECEELKLELRTPPSDHQQLDPNKESEVTEDRDSREVTPEAQSQKEAEAAQKVTLKELANKSQAKKVEPEETTNQSQDNKSEPEQPVRQVEPSSENAVLAENRIDVTADVHADPKSAEIGATDLEQNVESKVNEDTVQQTTEIANVEDETKEEPVDTESVTQVEEVNDLTAEDVMADMEKKKEKETLMLQGDTTDSELGKSTEDIQGKAVSEDEFENSLEEILERDLNLDADADLVTEVEIPEDVTKSESVEEEDDEKVAMDTKTPVPTESVESPPTVTPVPTAFEEEVKEFTMEREDAVEMQISEVSEDESFDEEEYQRLLDEEYALKLEEEELLAIESELRKKIETERCETDRLQQEIDELQYLRQDSDEEVLSTSSDSSYESEDEEDLQEILSQLIKENEELEKSNSEMCGKIHEERMICLAVKVQIGILQHKQVQNSVGSDQVTEKDSLIEFD